LLPELKLMMMMMMITSTIIKIVL